MLQVLNCRFLLKLKDAKFLLKKKKLILFFFYQVKTSKNEKKFYLHNFYQNQALLANLIIKIFRKKLTISFVLLKKNFKIFISLQKKNIIYKNNFLTDIVVYDVPGKINRFTLIYLLQSLKFNSRLEIIIKTNETAAVDSLNNTFKGSCWVEREIWDLFGIFFFNHSDLRRLLTDYNFEGHPLRKDFPLSGYVDVFYDDKYKKIIYTPVELSQEYRVFNFSNIWKHV